MRNEYTDCVLFNDDIYYFIDENGIPVKENRKENKIVLLTSIEGLKTIGRKTIFLSVKYKDYLIGLEQSAESILSVNIYTGAVNVYKMSTSLYKWGNIAAAFLYNNLILCFLKRDGVMYAFDLEKKEVMEKHYSNMLDKTFNGGILIDDKVYLASNNDHVILEYSLSTGKTIYMQTKKYFDQPVDLKKIGDDIAVLESNGDLTYISQDGEIKKEFSVSSVSSHVNRFCITNDQSKSIILPGTGNEIILLDNITGNAFKYNHYPEDFVYREATLKTKYGGCDASESYYYYANRMANYALRVNRLNGEIEWDRQIEVPEEVDMAYFYSTNSSVLETDKRSLTRYLYMVSTYVN